MILIANCVMPPFGIAVLYGRLDSALSWWTHGEVHCLTWRQMEWIRIQLVILGCMYIMLVVLLGVLYTQNKG